MTPLIILFAGSAALIIALAVPMMQRRVRPNGIYGLRTPATFADEWVWYEANARSGFELLVFGVVLLALALVLPVLGIGEAAYGLGWSATAVIGAVTVGVVGWRRATRLLEERRSSSSVQSMR